MKIQYYCIRDIKSNTFNRPFGGLTVEQVKRSIYSGIKQGDSEIAQFPEDFELYLIADFDDQTGIITGQQPAMICNCREIVSSYERKTVPVFKEVK